MLTIKKDLLKLAFSNCPDLIFDELGLKYEIIQNMIGVNHESSHHREKTVDIHTKMVLLEMNKYCITNNVNKKTRLIWMLTALLHDCAKKQTKQIRIDKITKLPKPTFYGHDLQGEKLAFDFLNNVFKQEIVDKICLLIRFHMAHARPLDQWTDKAVKKMKEKINGHIDGKDLLAIFTCDNLGRMADNIRDIPDLVKEKLKEI